MIRKRKEKMDVPKMEIKERYIHDYLEKTNYVTTAGEIVADRCVAEIYKSEYAKNKLVTCKGRFEECRDCWLKFKGE